MATTAIEWTDVTWNPIRGCSVISPGCVNCYAMKQAHRFSGEGRAYEGLTKQTSAGPQWTGQIAEVVSALNEPLRWKNPVRVFVNSMSDLFHEGVSDEFIAMVFSVMAQARRHTFQILTKRPERMRAVVSGFASRHTAQDGPGWPLPNVWLGVSVENQQSADARIPLLLQTPATVRFISYEPALEQICIESRLRPHGAPGVCADIDGHWWHEPGEPRCGICWPGLDWVIVGGESGPGARPFHVDWARQVVQHCHDANVPVFVKQLGAVPICDDSDLSAFPSGVRFNEDDGEGAQYFVKLSDRKGGDMAEWPEDLRFRQFPEVRA